MQIDKTSFSQGAAAVLTLGFAFYLDYRLIDLPYWATSPLTHSPSDLIASHVNLNDYLRTLYRIKFLVCVIEGLACLTISSLLRHTKNSFLRDYVGTETLSAILLCLGILSFLYAGSGWWTCS
jgi:hypothetical protein